MFAHFFVIVLLVVISGCAPQNDSNNIEKDTTSMSISEMPEAHFEITLKDIPSRQDSESSKLLNGGGIAQIDNTVFYLMGDGLYNIEKDGRDRKSVV